MLFSCTENTNINNNSTDESSKVTFTSDLVTRVDAAGFELNDVISVAAYNGTSALTTNTAYKYDGAIFTSDSPIEYENSDQQLSFYAVYPEQAGSIMSFDFEVAADQRDNNTYEMCDLLTSSISSTQERQPQLSFYHRMSSVVINVISDDDFSSAVLTFNAKTTTECNLSDATFSATGSATTIYAADNSNIGFKAIVAPQTIDANSEFAVLTIEDKVYTWTLIEDLDLGSGRQYIYNWDVATNNVSLTGVINDWGESEGETGSDVAYTRLNDYSSTSYPTDTDEWIIYDMYANATDFAGLRDALNTVSQWGNREISIGFTNLTSIPSSALYESSHSTTALTRLSLPCVTRISYRAFYYCTNLETLSTPELIYIEDDAFYGCSSLTSLNLSKVLSIGGDTFRNCTSLESLTFESIESIASQGLCGISNLKSVSLPVTTTLNGSAMSSCTSLQSVDIPNVSYVGSSCFSSCSLLQSISIPKATYVGTNAFYNCDRLEHLSIATESVLTQFSYTFSSQDVSTMTLTIGSANSHLIDGNTFKAPNGSGGYVEYTFYKINVVD